MLTKTICDKSHHTLKIVHFIFLFWRFVALKWRAHSHNSIVPYQQFHLFSNYSIIAEGFEFPRDAQLKLTVIVSVCLIKLSAAR